MKAHNYKPLCLGQRLRQWLCLHNYCLTGFIDTQVNGRKFTRLAQVTCLKCNHSKSIPRHV